MIISDTSFDNAGLTDEAIRLFLTVTNVASAVIPEGASSLESYLADIPGKQLSAIYDKWGDYRPTTYNLLNQKEDSAKATNRERVLGR